MGATPGAGLPGPRGVPQHGAPFLPLLEQFGFFEYLKHDPDVPDSEVTVEYCARHNWTLGSPDTVAEKLADVYEQCDGFGKLLVFGFDYADTPQVWRESMRMLAEEVGPKVASLSPSQPVGAA